MSTQIPMKLKEKKPVRINCVRQNCYVLGRRTDLEGISASHIAEEKKYVELKQEVLPNGYVEKLEEVDYPINSASVTSYADGADYRNDPLQAVANAPKRVNLGDISEVQAFIEKDPQTAVRVFRDVIAQLKSRESGSNGNEEPAKDTDIKTDTEIK